MTPRRNGQVEDAPAAVHENALGRPAIHRMGQGEIRKDAVVFVEAQLCDQTLRGLGDDRRSVDAARGALTRKRSLSAETILGLP